MKRIIKGKQCNTETARKIGSYEPYPNQDESWYKETMYITKAGSYFMYGFGNWQSKYAEKRGNGNISGGDGWLLFTTTAAARQWAEEHLKTDEFIAAFGDPEDGSSERLTITISAAARAKLDTERDRTGETLGEIVERAIIKL